MGVDTLMRRAVFLDRDGVINRTTVHEGVPHPPMHPGELELLPGVAEALAALAEHGFALVVVTNQPDVARGMQTRALVEQINQALLSRLPLDTIDVCYHDNADGCTCRKPLPGLLVAAAQREQIDLSQSFMVGDRWSDIAAGTAAGCTTFLLDAPYNQRQRCAPDYVVASLFEAAQQIIGLVTLTEEPRV